MTRTTLAGLVSLACLWLFAALFSGQRLPSHTASATLPGLGLTVTAELFPLSDLTEFERHLTLAAADGTTVRARMPDLRGPADWMGLYRTGDGMDVAVLDPTDGDEEGRFFSTGPLRRLDGPPRQGADWVCLGAFTLAMVPNGDVPSRGRAQVFAFVPAAPEGEAHAAPRPGHVQRVALGDAGLSCPLPGPMEGGGPRGGGAEAPRRS